METEDWEIYDKTSDMEIETKVKVQFIIMVNLNEANKYSSGIEDLNKRLSDGWKIVDKHHITFKKMFDKGLMVYTLEKQIPKPQ